MIRAPYTAAAEKQIEARILADVKGVVHKHAIFFAERQPACTSQPAQKGALSVTLIAELRAPGWLKVVEAPTPRRMVLESSAVTPASSVP